LFLSAPSSRLRLAIAGDLHGEWSEADAQLLAQLAPDAVLFVGDLSDGDLRLTKAITRLPQPTAVILGNHDRGRDRSGSIFQQQINLLGDLHCGWRQRRWTVPRLGLVGCRPGTAGGGFHLSKAVEAVVGPISVEESADRIVQACASIPRDWPLVLLAHCGPTGLGSNAQDPCGRDWKQPACDWGDADLALALDRLGHERPPQLVVFGHMHHRLKGRQGERRTFHQDRRGTVFLNAACVPRRGLDEQGRGLCHFSWVEFDDDQLSHVSHRWFLDDGSVAYAETLYDRAHHDQDGDRC